MKHLLPDPDQEKELNGQLTIYSCEFDNGERARGNGSFIRLGDDGKIFLFLCQSCQLQLEAAILGPLVFQALRHDKRIPEILLESLKNKGIEDKDA